MIASCILQALAEQHGLELCACAYVRVLKHALQEFHKMQNKEERARQQERQDPVSANGYCTASLCLHLQTLRKRVCSAVQSGLLQAKFTSQQRFPFGSAFRSRQHLQAGTSDAARKGGASAMTVS